MHKLQPGKREGGFFSLLTTEYIYKTVIVFTNVFVAVKKNFSRLQVAVYIYSNTSIIFLIFLLFVLISSPPNK